MDNLPDYTDNKDSTQATEISTIEGEELIKEEESATGLTDAGEEQYAAKVLEETTTDTPIRFGSSMPKRVIITKKIIND